MTDYRQKFILEFSERGADRVQAKIDQMNASASGEGRQGTNVHQNTNPQRRLNRQTLAITKALSDTTRGLSDMLKQVREAEARLRQLSGGGTPLPPPPPGSRGGPNGESLSGYRPSGPSDGRQRSLPAQLPNTFIGGLTERLTPYFHEGQFQGRRFLGSMTGRAAFGLGRVASGSVFGGISGFAQGLGSLPGGGIVGGALTSAVGMTHSALNYERARLGVGITDPNVIKDFKEDLRSRSIMNRIIGMQFAQQLGLSGVDRTFQQAQQSGALGDAVRAQTLGIGSAENLGVFLRAQRRGGIVEARENDVIRKTIENAFASGFDRSEASRFLSILAQGQQRFEQTGMPISRDSLLNIAKTVAPAVGQGGRSLAFAQQLTEAGKRIAKHDPQTPEDSLLLTIFGGYDPDDRESYFDAIGRLESGEAFQGPEGRKNLLKFVRYAGAGSGGGGFSQRAIQKTFQNVRVDMGWAEAGRLQGMAMGRESPNLELMNRVLGNAEASQGLDLDKRARQAVQRAAGLRGAADIENQRIDVGQQLLPAVHQFEANTMRIAEGVAELAPTLLAVAEGAGTIAEYLPGLAESVQDGVNRMTETVEKLGERIEQVLSTLGFGSGVQPQ